MESGTLGMPESATSWRCRAQPRGSAPNRHQGFVEIRYNQGLLSQHHGGELEIRLDNTSAIAALRKGRSNAWWLNNVARHFRKLADSINIHFRIYYVESAANKATRVESATCLHVLQITRQSDSHFGQHNQRCRCWPLDIAARERVMRAPKKFGKVEAADSLGEVP